MPYNENTVKFYKESNDMIEANKLKYKIEAFDGVEWRIIEDIEPKFKQGDVVCHAAGETRMAIVSISDDMAVCSWEENGSFRKENFPLAVLRYPPKPTAAGWIKA